ncbi:cytochrome P450 [Coniophora puteana RWD-64-598 SS2]|uniref:Cytochrome P450 n=1 Tax=Coniophora puteana (strain RWD-64-598) TaxID=741705 RepID=A0A5M3N107_CONPW|nr:cytochrome P450 [Coniophora puteana RWD-64-598 SS2]EIW84585.1 cytochrome P450 [Coniophora puteana RWD-64-598 SS2]
MQPKASKYPGVALLARLLGGGAAFYLIVTAAVRFTAKARPDTPLWALYAAAAASLPVGFAIRLNIRGFMLRRAAARMGARPVPIVPGERIGNIDLLFRLLGDFKTGYPGDGMTEAIDAMGNTFNFRVMYDDLLFTTEPHHIKTILATEFDNFVKGDKFHANMLSVLGTGVFNSDGDMWKFHRSMTRPFFTHNRISHFDIFDRHAEHAMSQMKLRLRAGYAVDFQDWISRFTLDSATEFLFGNSVDSLSAGLPYPYSVIPPEAPSGRGRTAEDFARAFSEAQFVIAQRPRKGWVWPLFEVFGDKSEPAMRVVNAYIEPILQEAIERQKALSAVEKKADTEVADDDTVLDHLVRQTTDLVVLKDEILNIMIAGRDTTAATMTFVMYFLAMHPDVLSRLREEVLTKIGPSNRPTYDGIRDMKYLRAVINETLRLYPAVPFNVRESKKATVFAASSATEKPFYIPPKTMVSYSVFLMHRRKDLWGPDADKFDPDRFLDERLHKYLTPNPFIFLPFNAGPRICLGQQFAYNEMSFMLIRLLQNFSKVDLAPEAQNPETRPPARWREPDEAKWDSRKAIEEFYPKMHLTMYAHGGLWVKLMEADLVEAPLAA